MDYPTNDLVTLLIAIMQNGDERDDGPGRTIDAGGTVINAGYADPFEKHLPVADIWTAGWRISFLVPKATKSQIDGKVRPKKLYIDKRDIKFEGDEEAFLRDLTFVKMMF